MGYRSSLCQKKEPTPSLNDVINSLQQEEKKIYGPSKNSSMILSSKAANEEAPIIIIDNKKKCSHYGKDKSLVQRFLLYQGLSSHSDKKGHASNRCFYKNKWKEKDKDNPQD